MAIQIQRRRGSTSSHSTFTGASGELTVDTSKNTVVVHNGAAAGGFPLPTLTGSETLTNKTLTSPDINGGTIDGTVIGGSSAAAGSFTTLSASDTVSITKAAGVAKAVLTSATGTNEAYYQLVNGGGGYYFGVENNAGSWFGATPYAGVVQAPAGKVVQTVISATPITTVSSSGLAVTGVLSSGNGTIQTAISYDTDGIIGTLSNHSLKFFTNSTAKMTLDTSGNLGIGVTPSAWWTGYKAIDIGYGSISDYPNSSGTQIAANAFHSSNDAWSYKIGYYASMYQQSDGKHSWYTAPSGTAGNPISFTQAMTLDANGDWMLGKTSSGSVGVGVVVYKTGAIQSSVTGTGSNYHMIFSNNDGYVAVGSITSTGSTTTYATSSDYRLKNVTGPVTNSGAYIDSLNPVEGTWKADGSTFVGLIAHEVQEASRTPVATGTKDGADMQAMDYSSAEIIANLIAEVKSLRQRVAQLEG